MVVVDDTNGPPLSAVSKRVPAQDVLQKQNVTDYPPSVIFGGGVWVLAPDGTHLGTIKTGEVTANVGWGNDGRTLYMTSSTSLYRVALTTEGVIPGP